ncbi:RNA polymerase II transcription factor SIII subunit A-domain-containing protein [Xylariaceae sp. FL0662B]|nr:RNA polymerase II transcription factor SIII subunit A-domain-containing protein [Xylariaceae sp. FL0662B]
MVKSLIELCTAVCIKNIKDITDVGGMPFAVLRPILLKVDSAAQLRTIEASSPHLEGDTAECWKRLIKRDYPVLSERLKFEPRNPASWHKIYDKYQRLEAEQKKEAEEKLKNAFSSINKKKEASVSQVIDYDRRILPRAPREGRGLVRKGTSGKREEGIGGLRFTGGSRTKTNTAQSIMKKARREAMEIGRRNRLATPSGMLPVRQGQIAHAPLGMVEEHRIKSQPLTKIHAPHQRKTERDSELEERETRLRKIKNAVASKGATLVDDDELADEGGVASDSDLEQGLAGSNEDGLAGLFDDEPPTTPAKTTPAAHTHTAGRTTTSKSMSGLAMMKRGLTHNKKTTVVTTTSPTKQPASRPPPTTPTQAVSSSLKSSSPPKQSSSAPAASASSSEPNPLVSRKRKPVDIFMKPKPKAPRRP